MRKFAVLPIAALAFMTACDSNPAAVSEYAAGEIVVTQGIPAPAVIAPFPGRPQFSTLDDATVSLGGSSTTPVSINGTACATHPAQQVVITYTLTGNQASPASFKVDTKWDYNGTSFVGSVPTTVNLPIKSGGGSVQYQVTISVENSSGIGTGSTSFAVAPHSLVTNMDDSPGQRLSFGSGSTATVHVAFNDCTPSNTAPSLTIPADLTVEATSSAGAAVTFSVPANDAEDGDLTSAVVCTPASGSTFALGETTVNCSVEDSGGLTAQGSFKVNVEDTTPPVISGAPAGPVVLIAENISGATFDASGITATDLVDGSVAVTCSPLSFGLGQGGQVLCEAVDAAGNKATAQFHVSVTLDMTGAGFLSPLRMASPFSAHKLSSAVPHKIPAPRYADGSLATDLAGGLRLVLTRTGSAPSETMVQGDDYSAGSTAWRYDAAEEHYIFNLKTSTKSPWGDGAWLTTVSYGGITLASTTITLRK